MTDDMRQAIYLNKVLTMVQDSILKPRVEHESEFECELCQKMINQDEAVDIEFRKQDMEVCVECSENLPEEYPVDEDMFRGDR